MLSCSIERKYYCGPHIVLNGSPAEPELVVTPAFAGDVQHTHKMTIVRCLIVHKSNKRRFSTDSSVISMNNESLLAVCLSPSVSLSVSLQRITRPPRTWRATRQTRPTPTLSVTTWPIWEPLPGTRRSTATRSAWRRATVRVISSAFSLLPTAASE